MAEIINITDARRALLTKYVRNNIRPLPAAQAPLAPRPLGTPAPLSHGQQQMWLLAQLTAGIPVYNECLVIALPSPLDPAILARSFAELLARHEAWRTTLPLVDDQPIQQIQAPRPIDWPTADLRDLPAGEREAAALRLAEDDARQPFNLAGGPLWRALLVRLDQEHYRLYLTLHHLIFDGVALGQILLPELAALYAAFAAGKSSPLPPLPIQYADYALWQREPAQRERQAKHLAYWREKLAGAPARLELPTDRPRPVAQSYRGALYRFDLDRALADNLKALGQREGATLFMTLLAAYQVFLARHTGQEDIAVGTATAGRGRSEFRGLLGLFINTIVLRTDLGGAPSFRELLRRVREVTLEGLAHDEAPFEQLVRELHPDRDLSYNPLFQTLLTLEPPLASLPPGWDLRQMEVPTHTAKFDLSLKVDDRPEGLIGRFEYNADLFDRATIARFAERFAVLLRAVVADPEQPITTLPLLPPGERRQLLVGWNETRAALPDPPILQRLFEEAAARHPGALAVTCADEQLTYGELNARANQLAHHLRARGVGPDVLVGVCCERSVALVVALLGVLKAGGAYLPLDPAYPPERVGYMLHDARVPVLLTQRALRAALPPTEAATICLDTDWPTIARESAEDPAPVVGGEHLAYVIYTSGSTGRPKGVQIPQRAVVNFLASMRRAPGLAREDTLLAVTTLSFDIAALEIFLPLTVGARLVLVGREVAADGARLLAALDATGATVMQATPATWRLLLAAGWAGRPGLRALCGGEALPRELAEALLPRVGELWNLYGPTETTIWSLARRVESGEGPVPIGGPIANTQIYLLDRFGQPVPLGAAGELHIGGLGVARGYLGRPDLTAERFVADPFRPYADARLYKTGDLARYRPDGGLEFLGRLDGQVKLRGFRIELGEIEAALAGHPAVRQAVVLLERGDDPRLVAHLVAREGAAPPEARDLRAFLKASLPEYMVPAAFAWREAFPLTPNGKVDRRALAALAVEAARPAGADHLAPRDDLERQLVAIWEATLGVAPIGVADNFFDLGGHSLVAVRLFGRIEAAFGRKLPLATLFQAPTIAELAALLRQQGWQAPWSSLVALQPRGTRPPFFCVHAIGGNVLKFRALARHLGPDQPMYGLQARGLDGRASPATAVEAMAEHYLAEVQTVQPRGPYYLGGQCFGGMVALEMARQLQARGERVGLLAMFDDYAPGYTRLLPRAARARLRLRWLRQRGAHHLGLLRRRAPRDRARHLAAEIGLVGGRVAAFLRAARLRRYDATGADLPPELRNVRAANQLAQRAYVPGPFVGQPALFMVDHTDEALVDPDPLWGWGRLATEGIATYEVPGDHETMWEEPHAAALGERLRAVLDEAQARAEAEPRPG